MSKTEKDAVFAEAQEKFDVKLDRRLKLSELKAQIEQLSSAHGKPKETPHFKKPKTVKNIFTGNEFSYNEVFAGDSDLEVIEWEIDDGNN